MSTAAAAPSSVDASDPYRKCISLAGSHYENFTFLSRSLPREYRPHMAALYSYCRCVDDLGDEADGDRLALLDRFEKELREAFDGKADEFPFSALKDTIKTHEMRIEPFLRLIEANRRDQTVTRYQTYAEVVDYCVHSAMPVGRMVLDLFGHRGCAFYEPSDATCTALQLANFWQDVSVDIGKGRIYIPLEDLERFGVSEEQIEQGRFDDNYRKLMQFECDRAENLFHEGWALIPLLPKGLRYVIALFTFGGHRILRKIRSIDYRTVETRPVLGKLDKARVGLRARWHSTFTGNPIPNHPEVKAWP